MLPSVANALARKRIATFRFGLCNLQALTRSVARVWPFEFARTHRGIASIAARVRQSEAKSGKYQRVRPDSLA